MLVFTAYFGLAQQAPSPSDRVLASLQEKQTLAMEKFSETVQMLGPLLLVAAAAAAA